jgi:hypothetical protein
MKWSMVNGQWSMVNGQWSMVNGQWSMVNGQWSMVNGQWSIIVCVAQIRVIHEIKGKKNILIEGCTNYGS